MQEQLQSTGRFATLNAQKFMTQLCKHFAHKVPAETEGATGRITFEMGTARLEADDAALTIRLEAASPEAIQRLQQVIDSHLQRFAFREDFKEMQWQGA